MNDTIYNELARVFSAEAMIGPDPDEKLMLELLQHSFTEEEAAVAIHLPFYYKPAPIEKIIKSIKRPEEEVRPLLDSMVQKGLIRGRTGAYALLPVLPGMFENVLMDNHDTPWHREFSRLASRLYETGYVQKYLEHPTTVLRSIPVNISYDLTSTQITPDRVEEMIRAHDLMAVVNNCQCRQAAYFEGDECKRADRTDGCLAFGTFAKSYIERGGARQVDRNSMHSIIKDRMDKKLVFFAANVAPASTNQICTCCDCCCHMLGQVIRDNPSMVVTHPKYLAVVNEDKCINCGKCLAVCNLKAHDMVNKKHIYFTRRCIGCGYCIAVCPTAAIDMVENPKYRKPASNFKSLALRLAPSKIMAMVKSKLRPGDKLRN